MLSEYIKFSRVGEWQPQHARHCKYINLVYNLHVSLYAQTYKQKRNIYYIM